MRAGGSTLFPRGQPLLHKMPVVIGSVVEPPKLLIAQLFIEAACLKAERVEPCRVTAALAGADFRSIHQLAPDASAAQFVRHPKIFYEQPPAIGFTCQPGDNLCVVSDEKGERSPGWVLRPLAFIVSLQGMWQDFDISLGGGLFPPQS